MSSDPTRDPVEEQPADAQGEPQAEGTTQGEAEAVTISAREYHELRVKAGERDEYLTRLQRAVADYQNLLKRLDRIREFARRDAVREVLDGVMPMADDIARALEAMSQVDGGESLVDGLRILEKDFYEALGALNVKRIEAVGKPFDPHYHEAVLQEPTGEVEPGHVVREMKIGFTQGNEVLRPAQVAVAAPEQGC